MKCRRVTSVGLAALLMLAVGAPASSADTVFSSSAIANSGSVTETNPETDGEWVVYQTNTPLVPGSHSSLAMRNLKDNTLIVVGGGDSANQSDPDVSLGRLAYEDDTSGSTDVRVYDPGLALDYAVASTGADEVLPRISGNLVAWYNQSTDEIWYRDISRGLTAKVPDAQNVSHFDVDRGRIVWSDALITQNLYTFEPGRDSTSHKFYTAVAGIDIDSLTAHDHWAGVTLGDAGEVDAFRADTDKVGGWHLTADTSYPAVFHDSIAVQKTNSAQEDLLFYQFSSPTVLAQQAPVDETDPSLFGRRVVFERATGVLNKDVYAATAAAEVDRTQGTDRYLTAVEASKAYFSAANAAVLCTGANFPDALAAGPLARLVGGPLLLTRPDEVPAAVMAELSRLGVNTVFLVGGSNVITSEVQSQLATAGYATSRTAGDDRYGTSVAVANTMDAMLGGAYSIDTAYFARGDNFPDALALGPIAAGALSPILLVRTDSVPPSVSSAMNSMNITSGAIAGGPNVVSSVVEDELESLMQANGGEEHPIERWYGADRYATALAVIDAGLEARLIDLDTVGVATGRNFPDALGAGGALGRYGSPVLLVNEAVPAAVGTWVDVHDRAIGRMDIFGGPDVIPESVRSSLVQLLE